MYMHMIIPSPSQPCLPPSVPGIRDSYRGALSQEEMEPHKKTLALALLQERERELKMIRDGQLTSSKVGQHHVTLV